MAAVSKDPGTADSMDTILVVDDEKNYLVVMAALLTEEGYEVVTAQSAVEALGVIAEKGRDIDLVLTDMKMPNMDGIQLLPRSWKPTPTCRSS